MTNLTALLLVMTLTGAPVASVVCATECHHEPAAAGHCHQDMAASGGPMMSASNSCNDLSISDSPYVIEHRAVPGAAVLTTASLPAMPDVARTDAPAVPVRAADAWLQPPLVLRI
jgi:hypothetical protein